MILTDDKKIVIADAGPLIAFSKIKRLPLLTSTLGELIICQAVAEECTANLSLPGAKEIKDAISTGLIIVNKHYIPVEQYKNLFDILGKGEAGAIILAKQLNTRLLIDEKLGRQAANKLKLRIIGTAGVLLVAKKNGLIPSVKPILAELRTSGYYLSTNLVTSVLELAHE